ncbi:hypothetical protein LINGRAHAP2_LOCUS29893 [Linum grandiflorum]
MLALLLQKTRFSKVETKSIIMSSENSTKTKALVAEHCRGNHHLKNKRRNECSIETAESEEKHMVVLKRRRTSYDDTVKTDIALHSLESLEEYLKMSLEGLENANALSNIESALHAMIEHYSNKATAEESMLAELKRSVVEAMTSMQKSELRLSMLDAEMSLILEEEENIEAEIQEFLLAHARPYHVRGEFDENESTCLSILSGHHVKNKQLNECSINVAESEEKRMRTSYDATVKIDLALPLAFLCI